MPAARRPPAARTAPRPAPPPAPRPAPRPAAPRPAPAQPASRPAPRPAAQRAPAHAATAARTAGRTAPARAPARRAPGPAGRRPGAARPPARAGATGRPAAPRKPGKPAPKQAKGKTARKPVKGKPHKPAKPPKATGAQATRWYRVLASVYDANGGGGSCGNTSDGHYHYAELGVAGNYGHGAAHGEGNLARTFGRGGQLGCGFGLYVRYKGRTTFATKSDVGYGDVSKPPNADDQRSIDLLRNLADWLHFDGVDTVEVAFHTPGTAPAPSTVEPTAVYFNPLAHAHVTPERIDQGVDYAGTGYVVAIADCVITTVKTHDAGWEGGAFIEYRITQGGSLNGAYVFNAEGFEPNVSEGDRLNGGDKVCTFIPGALHGTEMGFGAGNGGQSYYAYHDGRYVEGTATRPGIAFSNLIETLGGPGGRIEGAEVGKWPEYVPDGDLSGVSNAVPAPSTAGGLQDTPQDAHNEALSADWGESVKRKWHNLQNGGYTATHHSNSARAFALGKTFVPMA